MPYVFRMQNYLRKTKASLPESVREHYPQFRSVSAVTTYSHIRDGNGRITPMLNSEITLVLIPKTGTNLDYKNVCTLPGPQFPEWQHRILIDEAKAILKDPARLEQILTEHLPAK